MADWIVSKLPSGNVEVVTDRDFPRQVFADLPEVSAAIQALCFIEDGLKWGDRILTRAVRW